MGMSNLTEEEKRGLLRNSLNHWRIIHVNLMNSYYIWAFLRNVKKDPMMF